MTNEDVIDLYKAREAGHRGGAGGGACAALGRLALQSAGGSKRQSANVASNAGGIRVDFNNILTVMVNALLTSCRQRDFCTWPGGRS
jgi:hypothetical protein